MTTSTDHSPFDRRRLLVLLVLPVLLLVALAVVAASAVADPGAGTDHTTPEGKIVVKVIGDADGWALRYSDGTSAFPRTEAQAIAACNAKQDATKRVHCRAQAHQWYRDLVDLQASLRWVRNHR